jgi:hypothetical protein
VPARVVSFFRVWVLGVLALSVCVLQSGSHAAGGDIVLYASDVTTFSGSWSRIPSSSGAGGESMATVDSGWSTTNAPLASPTDYFDVDFDAEAGTSYQIWLRLRGAADSKFNESVWVQFDDAIDGAGNTLWPIDSTSALLVNLEDCIGCGISGWGWQDNASWTGQVARIRFRTTGPQTLRVQVREDGVEIDQIVLSPLTWWSSAPGAVRNDTTIVPKPGPTTAITLVRHPYLQQVTNSSAIVVWATRESGSGEVHYQSDGGTVRVVTANTKLVPATLTGMGFDYYQHEAALTGLTAATAYTYRLRVAGIDATTGDRFVTAPAPGEGLVRFIAFGDSGIGSTEQRQLAQRMNADQFDFALHTGDVVYGSAQTSGAGGYPQLHAWFFDIYRDWLRTRPMFPSIGNHDDEANRAAPFRDVFVLPSHGASAAYPDHARRFYSFDYGAAHVVVLDTELAFQDPARRQAQLSWLVDDLAATTQPWKIAVFHRSPYSAGADHGSDLVVRSEFGPIFSSYGVSLVLSGHEHDYERTIPIKETADGTAVTYVVSGGGGARLYTAGAGWWTAFARSAHHYVRGSITDCQISIEAVGLDGSAFDPHTLDRCNEPVPPQPTPYGGTAATLPGVLQAEHFDDGGRGVAYVDSSTGNTGGQLRPTEDVDIQVTTDAGGGHNVGWMSAGEWLTYSADVAAPGVYTIEARVAAAGAGGRFHIEVNGADITGPMVIPNTGGWQNWQTVAKTGLTLAGGRQIFRFVLDANGPTGIFGNLNYLRVTAGSTTTPPPFGGTPARLPGIIEAENFDEGGTGVGYHDSSAGNTGGQYRPTENVDIEVARDTGGGYNVGWIAAGEWLSYGVDVAAAGTYTLAARVAANGQGGTFHVEVDGANITGPLTIPNTAGWQNWTTVSAPVSLPAGRRTLRVVFDSAGPTGVMGNLNAIRVQ